MRYTRWGVVAALLVTAISVSGAPTASAAVHVKSGTVMVRSRGRATIFLVRSGDGPGSAEHMFQLWANPGLDLNAAYRGVDVDFRESALVIVMPAEKRVVIYNLAGHPPPAGHAQESLATTTIDVVGIGHNLGPSIEKLTVSLNPSYSSEALPFEDPE